MNGSAIFRGEIVNRPVCESVTFTEGRNSIELKSTQSMSLAERVTATTETRIRARLALALEPPERRLGNTEAALVPARASL